MSTDLRTDRAPETMEAEVWRPRPPSAPRWDLDSRWSELVGLVGARHRRKTSLFQGAPSGRAPCRRTRHARAGPVSPPRPGAPPRFARHPGRVGLPPRPGLSERRPVANEPE